MKGNIKKLLRLLKGPTLDQQLSKEIGGDSTSDLNFLLSLAETSQGTFVTVLNLELKSKNAALPAIVLRIHLDKATIYVHGFLVHLKDFKRSISHAPVVKAVLFSLHDELLVAEFWVDDSYCHWDIGYAVAQYFNQLAYFRRLKCVSVEKRSISEELLTIFEEQRAEISVV